MTTTPVQINSDPDLGSCITTTLEQVNLQTNTDKFYHAYLIEDQSIRGSDQRFHVLFHWGRNGTSGQKQLTSYDTPYAARKVYDDKIFEKQKGGYDILGRHDVRYQPIPAHVLDRAGITPVFDKSHVQTPYDVLRAQVHFAVVGATGTDLEFKRTVESRRDLHAQINELKVQLNEMEGQLEVVDMLVMKRG